MDADVVIRGGTVIDGTGAPGRIADVAVTAGRISGIGPRLAGRTELDASGQIVAPGFIDIHTHYDAQVFWDPALTPSCHHGVTSVIAGNCGFSIAPTRPEHRELIARTLEKVEDMNVATLAAGIPWDFETFPEYLASVERHGTMLNFGVYVGHTALRLFVMGDEAYEREATPEEIAAMCAVVGSGLDAGAAGFATTLAPTHMGVDGKPVPSRHATRGELDALFDVVGERRRGVVAVTPGQQLPPADLYDLQRRIGVPITFTALLTQPTGWHLRIAEANEVGWSEGAQVWPQVTPRPLVFTFNLIEPFTLNPNPVVAALGAGGVEARRDAYADPAWRAKAWAAFSEITMKTRWDTFRVAESANTPELEGRRVEEIAEERGCTPFDVVLDIGLAHDLATVRFSSALANDDPEGVAYLLLQEHCTLGLSDAGAHVGQLCDAPQATDFLGNWIRDRSLMPLEKAVRKLTGIQADLFGFGDRGYLREGAHADVVVFDLDTIGPGPTRRVRDFPADAERLTADQPTGVTHVMVNGSLVRHDGVPVVDPGRPGQILRPDLR